LTEELNCTKRPAARLSPVEVWCFLALRWRKSHRASSR